MPSPSGASASSGPAASSDAPLSPPSQSVPPVPPPPSNPGAAGSDADADRLAASSPATPAAELARIAASRPDLHPALAVNPATYPDLVDWLRTSPDPAVQTALAQRTWRLSCGAGLGRTRARGMREPIPRNMASITMVE